MSYSLLVAPLLSLCTPVDDSSNWLRFRGNAGTSLLAERDHPLEWSAEDNVAWTIDVPGSGWSSPIVVGPRVFLTTAVQEGGNSDGQGMRSGLASPMSRGGGGEAPTKEVRFEVHCVALADGAPIWKKTVGALVPAYAIHPSNTYATESPTSDGERLYVTFGALGAVVCLDLEGEELWRVETGVHRTANDFGWSGSLLVRDGRVFMQNDNDEESFLIALRAEDGEVLWRAERGVGTSWGSPVAWSVDGEDQVVTVGKDRVIAYAAASGEEIWSVNGIGEAFTSSPTFDAERLYFGTSSHMKKGPLVAVPADANGPMDLGAEEPPPVSWIADRAGPGFPSPVVGGGYVYVVGSPAIVGCYDAETGEEVYRERLPDAATIVPSPWIAGDELFILDEAGTTFVVRVGEEFELVRTNELEGTFWSTPSVAGASLLLRAAGELHCIR
ncbi:MAG: PQQ-binding-like beta-propeller repeat protein [Planctomycetota bacterium]